MAKNSSPTSSTSTRNSAQIQRWLFTAGGVVAVFVIVAALNVVFSVFRVRADLTEGKLNSLSAGTRAILSKLDVPVTIRFYASQSENALPVELRPFAARVEDFLEEYRQASNGKIELQKLDPKPDTDAEDSANLDGIEPRMNESGQPVYLGISFTSVDQKVALPFLGPQRERQLEYDITRSISQVTTTKKPVIGIMTTLPMMGSAMDMNMMMMGQQGRRAWIIVDELRNLFEVRELGMETTEIPSDVEVLLIAHPVGITEQAEFAIDQFILKGGKVIAFLDPYNFTTAGARNQMSGPPQGSTLAKLLGAWGLGFDETMVVADGTFRTVIDRGSGREDMLAVLSLTKDAINSGDIVTGELESLLLPMPGAITGKPVEGLRQDILLHSSDHSQLIETFRAQSGGNDLIETFRPSGTKYTLALRLTGKFKTAFPDGPPKAASSQSTETPADGDADEAKAEGEEKASALKEGQRESSVIIFADSDILYDEFAVTVRQFFNRQMMIPMNENLNIVANAVEQLAGDENLISIRSRGDANRPFTVIRDLENAAEEKFRAQMADYTAQLSEIRSKLSEIETSKQPGQKVILTPEMQADLVDLRKKEVELDRTVRELRRQLRRDVDNLQTTLKWLNIAGMPLLVIAIGATVVVLRRRRQAAH